MNGRMTKKCGLSFKGYSTIPFHLIHLHGKMIHYGTNIAYIYVITPNSKKKKLLELHTSPVGGHSGFLKTYHRVKREFFWDGLKTDVQRFVEKCLVCQQNKVETIKTLGLLQPLSIPSQCWEEISMDFITRLPKSEGKTVIMVIVDRLTKYTHFFALSHPFKANIFSTTFMETVQKLHGSPNIIVSDRDPIFTENFWT
jgi:hypothetical protein